MKRLLIAFVILAATASVFSAFRSATTRLQQEATTNLENWVAETRFVAQARMDRKELEERVSNSRREFAAVQRAVIARQSDTDLLLETNWQHLSPDQCERLLAELGFNWNSTGDYLIVSKQTLHDISLTGMNDTKLTDAACQVLAITPEERGAIQAMTQRLSADYRTWAESHVQRQEPTGDVVAQYTLPDDAAFSESVSNTFASGIMATLGDQRGQLLLGYSRSWMTELGISGGGPTTMIVKRNGSANHPQLNLELHYGLGSTMSTTVSPWQPMPEGFRALFPGGWPDLAKREGFALPKEFQNK